MDHDLYLSSFFWFIATGPGFVASPQCNNNKLIRAKRHRDKWPTPIRPGGCFEQQSLDGMEAWIHTHELNQLA